MNKQVKIRNIMLILNKLLIRSRDSNDLSNPNANLMNNLLFDNKTIDLNQGIESSIIEEISESIMNN